jgi:hypothetical protein
VLRGSEVAGNGVQLLSPPILGPSGHLRGRRRAEIYKWLWLTLSCDGENRDHGAVFEIYGCAIWAAATSDLDEKIKYMTG